MKIFKMILGVLRLNSVDHDAYPHANGTSGEIKSRPSHIASLSFLILFSVLPETVFAGLCGPSPCPPPSPPPTPTVADSNTSGSFNVTVSDSLGSYGETQWSHTCSAGCGTVQSSSNNSVSTLAITNAPTGTQTFRARNCYIPSASGGESACSTWSGSDTIYVLRTPGVPIINETVTADACNQRITVSWAAGGNYPSGSIKYFTWEELVNNTLPWQTLVSNTVDLSRIRNSTTELATYKFRVSSRYLWNDRYSLYTAPDEMTTAFTMPECPPLQPGAPTLSQPNFDTATAVALSWARPTVQVGNFSCYRVRRRIPSVSAEWEPYLGTPAECTIGTSASTINFTNSASHARGQTYEYQVQARKTTDAGTSPWSAAASITIAYATPTAPGTPTFTDVDAYDPYGYTVNWSGGSNGDTGAVTYKLWQRVGTSGDWVQQTGLDTPTSETYAGKSIDTVYQYKVNACNPQNLCGPDSAIASISFPGVPGAITLSGINNSGRDYTLNWTAASVASGVTIGGYKIERSVNGQAFALWYEQNTPTPLLKAVLNATAGDFYQYKVRAFTSTAHGQYTSAFSYWVPQTPANVGGSTNVATPSLTLAWDRYNSADHYELQQSTDGGVNWDSVISVNNPSDPPGGNPSYSPASVTNGTSYTYRVRSCNNQNACSPYASNITLRVPYIVPGTPAAPAINVNSSAGTLSVSWSAVSGTVHYYRLERREQGQTAWTLAEDSTDLSFGPSGLDGGGKTYQFRVSACVNVDGCGTASSVASAYLPHAAPPLPNLSAGGFIGVIDNVPTYSGGYTGEYAVTWSSAGGIVQSYTVQEQEPGGSWQAANLAALDNNCITNSNECGYNKPPNLSGAIKTYRYRAQACNSDNCSTGWKEIAVQVSYYPLPGVPASLTISQGPTNQGAYTLRWTRPSGSAEVHYYYLDNSDTPTNPDYAAIPHDPNQAYFEKGFTGGVSGQTYNYRVRACYLDDNGCDAYTAPLAVYIPYTAPDQPGALSHSNLNASNGSYTLNWSAASGQVSNYEVQIQLADGQWAAEATTTAANRPITGHPNGETRSYRVRACNVDACGGYTAGYPVYVPHLTPGAPAELASQSFDSTGQSLTLTWTAPGSGGVVQNYEIQQSTNGGSTWQAAGSIAGPGLTLTGLSNGTTYHFRVRACNVDVCSAYTSSLQSYLPYAAPAVPGAISHQVSENNPASGAFTVHWNAPASIDATKAPVTHYLVDYSTNGGSIWQAAPTGGTQAGRINVSNPTPNQPASATLGGLTTGASYGTRLRACNADACSANTVPYQVYLPHPAPSAPDVLATNPSTADYDARRFTVQWTVPAGGTVHHYEIEGSTGLGQSVENWISIIETPATSYTFTDRDYGQTYRYRVRACSESGIVNCSAWDESADIRLKYPTPKKPSGVVSSALDQASGNYTLAWNGVLGWAPQYHYQLQQAPAGTTNWTAPTGSSGQWVQIDQTSHNITSQSPGDYIYRVRACNPSPDNDCGDWSNVSDEVKVLATPGMPGSLNVDVQSCRIDFTWTPPSGTGEGQYRYELAIQNGSVWNGIAWTPGTSHTMPVMTQGTNFTFGVRVRSLSEGIYSAWSGWRTVNATSAECDSDDYESNISISAPQYSETGQYVVQMYTTTQHNLPYVMHRYDQWLGYWDSALGGVTSYSGDFQYYTVTYNSFNVRPTGNYLYRFSVCTDNDIVNQPSCMDQGATFQRIVTAATTVLRDPGTVNINTSGLPAASGGVHLLNDNEFTLSWSAVSNTAPATLHYEIQHKKTETGEWDLLAIQTGTSKLITLSEYGVAHSHRVRACSTYQGYVNCGNWDELSPVKRFIGAPRFPAGAYPADGELQIYSRQVPVQWLPPWDMAESGIHHYEISLRSLDTNDGPKVLATPAPVTGNNSNPPLQNALVEVEQGGQMEFMIRACGSDSPASCGAALIFDMTVVIPPDPPAPPMNLAGQIDPDSSNDPFNGALAGRFSVQPSGGATYTLPLILPPGTAGVQPRLSLDYSSQAGNGIAGQGWSIGGLSFISRCSKTPDQDGVRGAVNYSANDAYCLDGQRLIEVGANQYRTEINSFRRIEKKSGGVCGTWFEMKTQANETMQYGNTADSCINAKRNNPNNTTVDVVFGWALNRVTDVSGNYIDYKYEEDVAPGANAFALDYVAYTGHNSDLPYTAVDFQYDNTRPDPVSGFQRGVGIKQTRRLTKITTGVNPANLGGDDPPGYGVYTLNYPDPQNYEESGDQISRVVSIGYCAKVGTSQPQCMEPLTFQWSPWQPTSQSLAGYALPHPFLGPYPGPDLGGRIADLDNDGLPDLIYAGQDHARIAFRNTGSGWQSWPAYAPPSGVNFVDDKERDLGLRLADITGDGKPELLTSIETSSGSGQYRVYRNDNGWVSDSQLALPAKFVQFRIFEDAFNDDGLRLVDLNADGLTDLIHGSPDGARAAWRNTGSTPRWTSWNAYEAPVEFMNRRETGTDWPVNPPQGFEDDAYEPTAWFADFDGDGLQDLLYKLTPHTDIGTHLELISYEVRLNTGTGWGPVARSFTATLNYGEHGPDAGVNVVDLNGDGLPDLLRGNRADDLILYNTGNSLWDQTPFDETPVMQIMGGDNIWMSHIQQHFVDLNHDGRTDVLRGNGSWLSTETAAGGWKSVLEYRKAEYKIEVLDVNGDGRMDMLDSHGGKAWTQLGGSRQIVGVTDGLGNTTEVKYKALTDKRLDGRSRTIYESTDETMDTPYQQEMNTSMLVVDRVIVNDGIGGKLTTEYAYKGLTAVIGGRGIQGFEEVTVISPKGEVARTKYAHDFPYTGMPLELEVRYGSDTGPFLNKTINEYCFADSMVAEGSGFVSTHPDTACGAYNDNANADDSLFVYLKKSTVKSYQLNNALTDEAVETTVITRSIYGAYGYLKESTVTTDDDVTPDTFTTHTVNVYDNTFDLNWGRLKTSEVTQTAPSGSSTRKTEFMYHPNGLLWKEIVEPARAAPEKLVTAHDYDGYGNKVETTVCAADAEFAACAADAGLPNLGSPGRSTTTVYDSIGRYPLSSINAVDHAETREYQHPLGLQTKLIGPNGIQTAWTYDNLGRKLSETTSFESTSLGTTVFAYHKASKNGYVPGGAYKVQTTPPAGAPARVYYDSLGRERRKLSQSLHGEWVAADTEYDRFGRVLRSSAPYFVYATTDGDTHWTVNHYDGIGRIDQVEVPLGDIDSDEADDGMAISTTDYQGFDTITTDPKGRSKLTRKNALNQTVRMVDDLNGLNIPVDYTYDNQGQLTSTTVDNNPATTISITYDVRGNKTGMTDPDMGHWDYQYNGYGELVWQRDAKLQVTTISYDKLGRMTGRVDDATGSAEASSWVYDTAAGAGIGKLHIEQGPS
jgi:YD repeat-containing protein